jgi:hypothetical protein
LTSNYEFSVKHGADKHPTPEHYHWTGRRRQELGVVTAAVEANVVRCFFTLKLSYERALQRVQGDRSRGASKDPAFLKWLHENFAQALPFLEAESVVVDTDELTQDHVVARLAAQISKHEHLR